MSQTIERRAAHTEGPWAVDETYQDTTTINGADEFPVAEVERTAVLCDWPEKVGGRHWSASPGRAYIERPPEEVAANRALIAAAPELLNALQDAEHFLNHYADDEDPIAKSVLHHIRAAIAKAEGR